MSRESERLVSFLKRARVGVHISPEAMIELHSIAHGLIQKEFANTINDPIPVGATVRCKESGLIWIVVASSSTGGRQFLTCVRSIGTDANRFEVVPAGSCDEIPHG